MARLYRQQVEEQEAAAQAGTPPMPGGYLGRVELAIPYGGAVSPTAAPTLRDAAAPPDGDDYRK
jgi:hypothetical protein